MNSLITCHHNADYDAMAALIGASILYPDAELLFPGTQEKMLQELFDDALQYLYPFKLPRQVDLDKIERLILVDASQPERLPHVAALLQKPGLEIVIWDHHPELGSSIQAGEKHIETLGATCSLLYEEIAGRGLNLDCTSATLLGLGIYGDTGSLVHVSTTERDLRAVAGLLANGMDLAFIAPLLHYELNRGQFFALGAMLAAAQLHDLGGKILAVAKVHLDEYLNDFAVLAGKFMEIQPCDAFFGLGAMDDKIQVVARSRTPSIDVGEICRGLGGGGHPSAASAVVRDLTMPQLSDYILGQVTILANPELDAGRLMSSPVVGLEAGQTLRKAEQIMSRYGLKAAPVFRDGSRQCIGWLDYQLTVKAISHGLGQVETAAYMQRNFLVVTRQAGLQELMDIIVGERQRLVPVVEGASPQGADNLADVQDQLKTRSVIGVVTRTDLMHIFMEESGAQLPQPKQSSLRKRNLGRTLRARLAQPGVRLLELAGKLGDELGFDVYAVGGFVRDLLMPARGKMWPQVDIDLVVEGDAITFARKLAAALGGRVSEHKEFMTAVVLFPASALDTASSAPSPPSAGAEVELRVDVASARLEYYSQPAALPTVELSSLKMDLYRRDFTINAMAMQLNAANFGLLQDFFDGQADIRQKRIRVLHALSFVEDPTRALRAVRFEQRYQFKIGTQAERLIRNSVDLDLIDKLSGKRITYELELILKEDEPMLCFVRLQEFGLLAAIHPQLDLPAWKQPGLASLLKVAEWHRRLYLPEQPDLLALLILNLTKNAGGIEFEDILDRLELQPARREFIIGLRGRLMDLLPKIDIWRANAGKLSQLYDLLAKLPLEGLLHLVARVEDPDLNRLLTVYVYEGRKEKPDIGGRDLQEMGLTPGPLFGRILAEVLAAKIDGEVGGREAQLEMASSLASRYLAAGAEAEGYGGVER